MRKITRFVASLAILFAVSAAASAGGTIGSLALQNKGKSIAVVSVSANNYGNSLQGWNSANSSDLMGSQLNKMVIGIEELLGRDWKVIPAATFAGKDEFQVLAGERRDVGLPSFDGKTMPLFSRDRKQLVKAQVDKETAIKLAQITGADFVLIAYSEWAVATGRFVPTSKALAKNVVGIYDATGKQVFADRSDTIGDRTLGAMGSVVVDQNSIGEWVAAYDKGIHALYGAAR